MIQQHPHLPQNGGVAIYARVATADKHSQGKTLAQTDALIAFAKQSGFGDTSLTLYEQDHGKAGNTGFDTREGLRTLADSIAHDGIKVVIVADEHRLFRDATERHVSLFIRLCQEHSVLVITPQTIYDFSNPQLVRLFRLACERGYSLLENLEK